MAPINRFGDEAGSDPHVEDDVHVERSRIALLTGSVALAFTLATGSWARAGTGPPRAVTVYKSPT
jgi:hypothetical protein